MKTLQFKVELLSDIILNQRAASKGNQETLDFIPGSNFLGIVASAYNDFAKEDQITVFHSSKVRFGDAHPLYKDMRALRTPVSFHIPKLDLDKKECYVHHKINNHVAITNKQLKQSRTDFISFVDNDAYIIKAELNFAIKSAYDREKRRSEDAKMYGYESMQKGMIYCFEINIDDDVSNELVEKIKTNIIGIKRVGRSRTAQYGLIEISVNNFNKVSSNLKHSDETVIYAESRLIFFDNAGNPTFTPLAEDFGIEGGKIDWSKSQIRTFAYSPYNYHRSSFDTERKGIEKGSVIVIEGGKLNNVQEIVGYYQNEGFGKVIINPAFFESDEHALSSLIFHKAGKFLESATKRNIDLTDDTERQLLTFLESKKKAEEDELYVYQQVNDFVENKTNDFKGDTFSSQWGTIRSLVLQYPSKEELYRRLFSNEIDVNGNKIGYLEHGIAKDKWNERGRKDSLIDFFNKFDEDVIQFALVNLSSEMAKK